MNRYDDVTVAKFNPLSMQEIMMVPMMKRKQHDDLAAQQEALRQGLAKVDPHDKYYEEALRIKNGLNDRISSQAELLAKQGINGTTQQDFLKLNREYQDTTSATGKLGQINAHKVNLNKTYADYVERSIKAGNSPMIAKMHAEKALQEHMQEPLYDDRGRVIDYSIKGDPAKYIDVAKRVQDYATAAGFTSSEWAKAAGALSYDKAGNRYVINRDASGLTETNRNNLNKVLETLNREISDPSNEVRQSIDYNFRDPQSVLTDVQTQLGIYTEDKVKNTQGQSVGSVDWVKQDDIVDDLDAVNVEGVDVSPSDDLIDRLNGISSVDAKPIDIIAARAGAYKEKPGDIKIKTINDAVNSPEYRKIAYGVTKGTKLEGKKWDSPEVKAAVIKYLKDNSNVTVQNRYVDPNSNKQGRLFASQEIPKDKKAASDLILERAQRGAYEVRDENGDVIEKDDLGKYKFTYSGDMTPKSIIRRKGSKQGIFDNPKQNIGARTGVLIDEDGKAKTVYISRSSDDFDTPQFKAMNEINAISKIADHKPSIYHRIKSQVFTGWGLEDVEVKYNKNSGTYNLRYKEGGKQMPTLEYSDDEFQSLILEAHKKMR
ncbi:MAG TPA: hypothetical protein VF680_16745 [Allosphingosinicella sp.]|jgi:hypothetical protein